MANQWYVSKDGKSRLGPYTYEQLKELAADGRVIQTDFVWLQDSPQWIPARDVLGLFAHNPATDPHCSNHPVPSQPAHIAIVPTSPAQEIRLVFTANKGIFALFIIAAIALSSLGGCLFYGFIAGMTKDEHWDVGHCIAFAVTVGSPFLIAVGLVATVVWNWKNRVLVCEDSIALAIGGKTAEFNWNQIAFLWEDDKAYYINEVLIFTTHRYTVQLADGRRFDFTDMIDRVKSLGEILHQQSCMNMMETYIGAFNSGQTIAFGPISLNQKGILYGGQILDWGLIGDLTLDHFGNLIITQRSSGLGELMNNFFPWCKVEMSSIPNPHLLLLLIRQITSPS